MRHRAVSLLWIGACVSAASAAGDAAAQIAVIDSSNLQENVRQYAQMVEQVKQLRAQLEELRGQHRAITGSYGAGALRQAEALAAQGMVPGSWQEVVKSQQAGAFGGKVNYYEGLMKAIDP